MLARLLFCALLALPLAAEAARHALLIGNGAYPSDGPFAPFDYPLKDVQGMKTLIGGPEFGFDAPLVLKDADKAAMDQGFATFLDRLAKGDTVLFYFSGHGVQVGGHNYLLPVGRVFRNGPIEVKYHAVNANEWVERIQGRIGVKGIQIAILDACSNDIGKGADGAGLASMGAGGTLIAFAASPGQRALARGNNGYSLYTGHLLEIWRKAPRLRADDIFKQARHQPENLRAAGRNGDLPGAPCRGSWFSVVSCRPMIARRALMGVQGAIAPCSIFLGGPLVPTRRVGTQVAARCAAHSAPCADSSVPARQRGDALTFCLGDRYGTFSRPDPCPGRRICRL